MNNRSKGKKNRAMELSCARMCEEEVWGKRDHKALVDALDALSDELRELRELNDRLTPPEPCVTTGGTTTHGGVDAETARTYDRRR